MRAVKVMTAGLLGIFVALSPIWISVLYEVSSGHSFTSGLDTGGFAFLFSLIAIFCLLLVWVVGEGILEWLDYRG